MAKFIVSENAGEKLVYSTKFFENTHVFGDGPQTFVRISKEFKDEIMPQAPGDASKAVECVDASLDIVKGAVLVGMAVTPPPANLVFGAIAGVAALIQSGLRFFSAEDPVRKQLKELTAKVKELDEKTRAHFVDMKSFITENQFNLEIITEISTLKKYMYDCLKYHNQRAMDNFRAAYEHNTPLDLAYVFMCLLNQKSTNPLMMEIGKNDGKKTAIIKKWINIFKAIMGDLKYLEAFGAGLIKHRSKHDWDRLQELSEELSNAIKEWNDGEDDEEEEAKKKEEERKKREEEEKRKREEDEEETRKKAEEEIRRKEEEQRKKAEEEEKQREEDERKKAEEARKKKEEEERKRKEEEERRRKEEEQRLTWDKFKANFGNFITINAQLNNAEKAAKIKKELETIKSDDSYYIFVFNECRIDQKADFYCPSASSQMITSFNQGKCNVVIYRSRTANSRNNNELQKIQNDVEACNKKLRPAFTTSEMVKKQLIDKNMLREYGFTCIINKDQNVAIAHANFSKNQRGPGGVTEATILQGLLVVVLAKDVYHLVASFD